MVFIPNMCKCCQSCLESCYWHFIEERFCFDESIANYQEPITKEEKNNNFCDNMAFYDSVSVIAGRAIVTIDPLPEKKDKSPIIVQPRRRNTIIQKSKSQSSIPNIPSVILDPHFEERGYDSLGSDTTHLNPLEPEFQDNSAAVKKTVSFGDITDTKLENTIANTAAQSENTFLSPPPVMGVPRKSLMERRQSRSLHLKINYPKEVPIIRQSSVPKFFVDTPEDNQQDSVLVKSPLAALQSPMICKDKFCYDLKSVVHMEDEKIKQAEHARKIHPLVHRVSSSSKLAGIKDRIKLTKSKSTLSSSNIPHSHHI
ncbi:unnamed protein product [Diabrotica balteata]|uniref:Uncharacterized protein n=1 Tax=Diabrotica balteata TaxID=107213 RepID=A0A9N9XCB2_DIABA|nr:unnamed protein product [Diabrotica balteata]